MEKRNIEYNSEREHLIIPEYGRNVQKLIYHAKTIEDDEFRQAFVEKVVDLMYQMNPQSKNVNDYKEKLWKHLFRIADYDINVTPPAGIVPTRQNATRKPDVVPYPEKITRYRHYGRYVQLLIQKALEMEDKEKQVEFSNIIGSYMKLAFKTWNQEHYVNDEIVKNDLKTMSGGVLEIADDVVFKTPKIEYNRSNSQSSSRRRSRNNSGSNSYRSNKGGSRRRRR